MKYYFSAVLIALFIVSNSCERCQANSMQKATGNSTQANANGALHEFSDSYCSMLRSDIEGDNIFNVDFIVDSFMHDASVRGGAERISDADIQSAKQSFSDEMAKGFHQEYQNNDCRVMMANEIDCSDLAVEIGVGFYMSPEFFEKTFVDYGVDSCALMNVRFTKDSNKNKAEEMDAFLVHYENQWHSLMIMALDPGETASDPSIVEVLPGSHIMSSDDFFVDACSRERFLQTPDIEMEFVLRASYSPDQLKEMGDMIEEVVQNKQKEERDSMEEMSLEYDIDFDKLYEESWSKSLYCYVETRSATCQQVADEMTEIYAFIHDPSSKQVRNTMETMSIEECAEVMISDRRPEHIMDKTHNYAGRIGDKWIILDSIEFFE